MSPAPPMRASGIPPGGAPRQQQWALPFTLFIAGFVILIVASKGTIAALPGYLLKGLGAALCVAGFLLVRRESPSQSRPPKPDQPK